MRNPFFFFFCSCTERNNDCLKREGEWPNPSNICFVEKAVIHCESKSGRNQFFGAVDKFLDINRRFPESELNSTLNFSRRLFLSSFNFFPNLNDSLFSQNRGLFYLQICIIVPNFESIERNKLYRECLFHRKHPWRDGVYKKKNYYFILNSKKNQKLEIKL